jgi:hypothetical protein
MGDLEMTDTISAVLPYKKRRAQVLGREMAYIKAGEGDPISCMGTPRHPTFGATSFRTLRD